jgi:SSS family solute:Na+ symporter
MYAMALLIQTLGLFKGILPDAMIFHVSIILSALIVLGYIFLGGLTSAIYNEVLQFFLIVAGLPAAGLDRAAQCGRLAGHQADAARHP